ncbi:MAG: hypothetical protein H7323_07360, partial [Frankiales bacterium]|nr:hypothetical protein [Frankiales bacterium]
MTGDPLCRALRLAAPVRARLLLAGVAAMVTVGCAVALAAVAAWLLGTAAGQPPVLSLSVAVVAVRALGLGRGLSRYVERLAGHDAALRVLAGTRADVWEALEPLLPHGVPVDGRGDLLERLVGDVDALQDLYLRALAPLAVAVGLGAAAVTATTLLLPAAGAVLAAGLAVAAVGIPALVVLLDSAAARRRTPSRIRLTKDVVETLEGAADLEAFGASSEALARVVASDEQMRRADRSTAVAAGAGEALQLLVNGVLVVAVLLVGIAAVAAGSINGVAVAVLVL